MAASFTEFMHDCQCAIMNVYVEVSFICAQGVSRIRRHWGFSLKPVGGSWGILPQYFYCMNLVHFEMNIERQYLQSYFLVTNLFCLSVLQWGANTATGIIFRQISNHIFSYHISTNIIIQYIQVTYTFHSRHYLYVITVATVGYLVSCQLNVFN
jgi:hypothetical protein